MSSADIDRAPASILGSLFPGDDEVARLARATDWASTSLGDPERWPPELNAAIRTVMPSAVPMLLWWGDDLVQIYNDSYRSLIGAKHPAAMGQTARESWSEVWDDIGPLASRVLDGESVYAERQPLFLERHGYLEATYWTFSYSPVRSADGSVLGAFVATTEVTDTVVGADRVGALRDLAAVRRTEVESLADAADQVMAALSDHRRPLPFGAVYLRHDGSFERVAAYGLDDASRALPPVVDAEGDHPVATVAGALQPRLLHFERDRLGAEPGPLGSMRPDQAFVVPLGSAGRRVDAVGVFGVNPYRRVDDSYTDFVTWLGRQIAVILAEVRTAIQERNQLAAVTALDESRRTFFANVSHEFRTPLTVILAAEAALRAHAAPEAVEHLDALDRAGRRLNRLVDALLDAARAEAGSLVLHHEPVDLAQLTCDVLSMFRSTVEAAGLALVASIDDVGVVLTDQEAWAKVVGNLVSNAYKFTDAGQIEVRLARDEDTVVLTVTDTGVGITEADVPRVFERFVQVGSRPARGVTGTGIGLALVRDLVRTQGGDVRLVSTPGAGTTVTVTLPAPRLTDPLDVAVAPVSATVVADLVETAAKEPLRELPMPGETGRPTVLVVEDHDDLRVYLTRLLDADGWEVTAVADVPHALRLERIPDLLVTDLMLPGASGLQLVTMLRDQPDWLFVPKILLTARTGPSDVADGMAAGADDYVSKPFDPRELLARVRTHYELAQERRRLLADAEDEAANIRIALGNSRSIGTAVGVIMASQRVTSEQAFQLLRRQSNETNRKLRDVAEQVVYTGSLNRE